MSSKQRDALSAVYECAKDGVLVIRTSAFDKVVEALAEPRLNCEVGTAEDQIERWRKFCHKFKKCDECPHMRDGELLSHGCFARWSQMPYEEGDNNESK